MDAVALLLNVGTTVLGVFLGYALSNYAQKKLEREQKRKLIARFKAMLCRELTSHVELLQVVLENLNRQNTQTCLVVSAIANSTLAYQSVIAAGFFEELESAETEILYRAYFGISQLDNLYRFHEGNKNRQAAIVTDLLTVCHAAIAQMRPKEEAPAAI